MPSQAVRHPVFARVYARLSAGTDSPWPTTPHARGVAVRA
jgi:hypothetical protein